MNGTRLRSVALRAFLLSFALFAGCGKDTVSNPVVPTPPADMVLIPAGSFRMGNCTGFAAGGDDEVPVHQVTITHAFFMSRTEVMQSEWVRVMGYNPSFLQGDSLPVEQVSWYDAIAYCNKRSQLEGLDTCYTGSGEKTACNFDANGYRLPTEAEWEYACRAGRETDFWIGNMLGDEFSDDPLCTLVGWTFHDAHWKTHKVALKQENPFGLFDMHGNLAEWCWDWYFPTTYQKDPVTDPRGSYTGVYRVWRGGSWQSYPSHCRSSARGSFYPAAKPSHYGFRTVRTL